MVELRTLNFINHMGIKNVFEIHKAYKGWLS